ncbi:hypothetical protein SDC9_187261 [bioreactor metagenome]|uniref:Uncharacterized protein n=1 Tax=bioreactor metagenome TaxID=1076179 RepID=A0A645HMR0_9ZZZZ
MIWGENDSAMERFKKFKKYLFYEFHKFPKKRITSDFELLYINKDRVKALYPNYYAFVVSWNKQKGFSSKKIKIPTKSGLLHVMGSGKADFCAKYDQFQKQKSKETSRNVYQCFAHLLLDHSNFSYGGAPQLVGLYRKPDTNGFSFGIVHNRKRYYNGLKIGKTIIDENIKWRNKYFENCEGRTKQRMPGAQIQDRDLGN